MATVKEEVLGMPRKLCRVPRFGPVLKLSRSPQAVCVQRLGFQLPLIFLTPFPLPAATSTGFRYPQIHRVHTSSKRSCRPRGPGHVRTVHQGARLHSPCRTRSLPGKACSPPPAMPPPPARAIHKGQATLAHAPHQVPVGQGHLFTAGHALFSSRSHEQAVGCYEPLARHTCRPHGNAGRPVCQSLMPSSSTARSLQSATANLKPSGMRCMYSKL